MRRRALAAAAVAALALSLAACGTSQQATEDQINDALGGSASVDMGPDGEMRVEMSEGSVEIGTGEFPDGWPADLGVIPGFELLSSGTTADALNAQMYAEGDQSAAVTDYVTDLQANQGWAVDTSIPLGTPNMWALTKQGKVVTIFSAPSGQETVVVFSISDR